MAEPKKFAVDKEKKKTTKTPLRKPRELENTETDNKESMDELTNTTTKFSSLSVNAPAFVPRSLNTKPVTSQPDTNSEESSIILMVQDILSTLLSNPGNFDSLMMELLERLNKSLSKQSVLVEMVETIFNMSIETRNLSYLGSRVCDFLSKNFTKTIEDKTFRKLFLDRVKQEFDKKDHYINSSVDRLQKFTLFMAELFSNMEILSGNTSEKYGILSKALKELIQVLLDSPTDANIICVINSLKLTGFSLEEFDKKSNNRPLSDIFGRLKDIASGNTFPKNIQERILSLIKLKDSNWGQEVSDDSFSSGATGGEFIDQPVFYGPDGYTLTPEELGFYDECYEDDTYVEEWGPIQDELLPQHFMNKEEEDAYELFLQESTYN